MSRNFRGMARLLAAVCALCMLAAPLAACNLPLTGEEEPGTGEAFPEEPPPGEPMPEEPMPEEPMPEEPPPGEPAPGEPMPVEPPPAEPAQPPQPQPGGTGSWTADVAVTDIYPGNQPTGQFHVRITNNGPGTLDNVKVEVLCGYYSVDKNNGQAGPSHQSNLNLSLSMKPGETQKFPTNLSLDLNTFEYTVGCDIFPGFNDPDPGNNSYTENFK
ncbi:MAG: hypothetical protein ACOYYJ_08175 [Chloroflexota bacterium]